MMIRHGISGDCEINAHDGELKNMVLIKEVEEYE